MVIKHGSLFSGIGGFDLAAQWMGWENAFHCEINPFGRQALNYYWPNAVSYEDITKTDFTVWRNRIDVLTGGFPCQPFSLAGKRKGTEDERHLWPEMLRAIREIKPRWIVGENVFGLVNWDGGLVFEQVQADLEAEGYEVQPYILPAAGVNAPHRRDRVWFVAHSERDDDFRTITGSHGETQSVEGVNWTKNSPAGKSCRTDIGDDCRRRSIEYAANPRSPRQQECNPPTIADGPEHGSGICFEKPRYWDEFPTQPPVRERNDGLPNRLVRYLTREVIDEISNTSKENRIKNVPKVWQEIQQEKVWESVRGLYSLESKEILLQTMQLYSTSDITQDELSPFSEKFCEPILRILRRHGEFRCSPQGQKLEKQRFGQPSDPLPYLPHEVALAARGFETAVTKFTSWHRNESIKAYGNAIVPQIVYQIFKAIQEYEQK